MKGLAALLAALFSTLVAFAGSAWAQGDAKAASAKPDTAAGQQLATKVCAACHGSDGNSPAPANPKLAAQFPEYMVRQLAAFKENKERKSPVMFAMAQPLSPADMNNVSAFYASQQAKGGVARKKEAVKLGEKLYRAGDVGKGLPACASCHGATGVGMPAQYPRLAGQHSEYTEQQLKAFRTRERANDPGRMMRGIADKMTDAEIQAVSDYIAGLR
jgi:cytochrome c553